MTALPERTVEAAWGELMRPRCREVKCDKRELRKALAAACDPALGPDRLVVAGGHEREVREDQTRRIVEWLRSSDHAIEARDTALGLGIPPEDALADAIEREFGGGER